MDRFRAILILAAAAAIAGCNSSSTVPPSPLTPAKPIAHVIIMMQENRSFNNIFAGFPGADTALVGKCEPVASAAKVVLRPELIKLNADLTERNRHRHLGTDIDHSHNGFQIECDLDSSGICRNDGFDKIGKERGAAERLQGPTRTPTSTAPRPRRTGTSPSSTPSPITCSSRRRQPALLRTR